MKKDVGIWNINSFGEFYMQIEEKYHKHYVAGLQKIRAERARSQQKLAELPGIRVFPSQTNYVMVELTNGMSATSLTTKLLVHNIGVSIHDINFASHIYQMLKNSPTLGSVNLQSLCDKFWI